MVEILEVIKKMEYPGILVLGPKTSKAGDQKFCGVSLCEKKGLKLPREEGSKMYVLNPQVFFLE